MPSLYRIVGGPSDNTYLFEDPPGDRYELVAEDPTVTEEDPVEPEPVEPAPAPDKSIPSEEA